MGSSGKQKSFAKYGLDWPLDVTEISIEMWMIRQGDKWLRDQGRSLLEHYQALQTLIWPEKVWHKWNILELKAYLENRIIGEMGPASSGKSFSAATNVLVDYYCFPDCTTVLFSSTEREMLEMRVWGEVKKLHRIAKERYPELPGNLIESRQRIVTDAIGLTSEGRDFRNGCCGVPCKKGDSYVGMGSFAGIKNKRVRLVADECSLMPQIYVEAISNLNKNPDFKCLALGNPKSTTDALGRICEPADRLGGWDGGIDQTGSTKTWETRFDKGICVQLVGSDSPNLDGELGIDLITQNQIDADIKFYGKDSLQFTMMNEGRMPRGEGSRRVITRAMCIKFHAMDQPVWGVGEITSVGFLDAAYGSVGGDRCIFGELRFGNDVNGKQTIGLVETVLVPVNARRTDELPEDQIAHFVHSECTRRSIPPEQFFYDSGMRTALVMALSRIWSPQVQSIDFGGPATDRPVDTGLFVTDNGRKRLKTCREHYFNFCSELWFSVQYAIEANQFRGMTEDVMFEGCNREWGKAGNNKIQVEPKEKMKARFGRSPDLFDALVTGVEGARRLGFVIARLQSPQDFDDDQTWKHDLALKARAIRQSYALIRS